jgi:DUF1680 family protein
MKEIPASQIKIKDDFWGPRLQINAEKAIYQQWAQLVKTGCIENFRLVADGVDGFREGYFFADSDAFKWLDAAARIYASWPSEKLKTLMDDFIALIRRTQAEDGYLYTYNQVHFPDTRWTNLQIEHELYCHGHLIEAGVSHFQATGERNLLEICIKAADLLVRTFSQAGPEGTPGHEEIEIALIRLYHVTRNRSYLDLAEHFIEQRGRIRGFFTHILAQNSSVQARGAEVSELREAYVAAHPEHAANVQLPPDNTSLKPPLGTARWFLNTATGKYFQQHKPVREQTIPVGHAVRFAYLETAVAMLSRENRDQSLLATLGQTWDHMVSRRMYVTGGLGALPNIEGFGRDYELDPKFSYSETCAALGNLFWNWEMTLLTREAKYADLFEWQLFNAAAVGLGQDGASYLYNNPLICEGGLTRAEWFKCPCCPSNVSRTWADLGKYVYSLETSEDSKNLRDLWIHQYVGNQTTSDQGLGIEMEAGLPWDGKVRITLSPPASAEFSVHLRIPSWVSGLSLWVNSDPVDIPGPPSSVTGQSQTACGYDPRLSWYHPVTRLWNPGDVIEIEFEIAINVQATHPKVKSTLGQVALSFGPLVYCLESVDNPEVNIFATRLDPASLYAEFSAEHFGGITLLRAQSADGKQLTFIPYYLWANRGESKMAVYVNVVG